MPGMVMSKLCKALNNMMSFGNNDSGVTPTGFHWGPKSEFDFEGYVTAMLPELENVDTESLSNPFGAFRGDPKHRTVVCKHWLLGLCQNGSECSFLHRLERAKMPSCKHGTMCKIKNCHMKHVDDQEVEECSFFKQGFCYNGPNCIRRHVKRLPDEIPKEESFDQSFGTANKKKKLGPNENYKVSLCDHWLLRGTCHFNDSCIFAHGEEELHDGFQSEQLNDSDVYDPTRFRLDATLELPFSKQARIAYYLFQAPDLRSLLISKKRQVWAVSAKMQQEINSSLRSYDHVVAYILVRPLKGLYGVVRIATGSIQSSHNPLQSLTSEFPVLWLRTMRVSLKTIAQLKIGTTGIFVGRTSTDAKFESKVGSEIMYIAYRKPEWDWSSPDQWPLAEESLIRMRINAGESPNGPPIASPDALFPIDWPDKMQFAFDKPNSWNSTSSALNSSSTSIGNDYYTLDFPGFIFNCSGPLCTESLDRGLFGLPEHMKGAVINPNAPLFYFDPSRGSFHGIFQAQTPVTENIDPRAFIDWSDSTNRQNPNTATSALPWQVKFTVVLESPPVFMEDPDLLRVFYDRGAMGVPSSGPLSLRETKALANLFAHRAGFIVGPQAAIGRKGNIGGQNTYVYKPPHALVEVVPIDIAASPFDVKKRVLGVNGSYIKDIVNNVGGQQKCRIRIRGIGSGYIEGAQELQEPLHFNISAETSDILQSAAFMVRELIDRARKELMSTA